MLGLNNNYLSKSVSDPEFGVLVLWVGHLHSMKLLKIDSQKKIKNKLKKGQASTLPGKIPECNEKSKTTHSRQVRLPHKTTKFQT